METTGATGGLVVGLGGEIVQSGTLSDRGETFELPLTAGRQSFGTLTLSGRGFTVEQRRTAATLVAHAAIALENARLHRIVARQALVDMLTGLANRRHCEEALASELMRAERFGGSVAFVLADLDELQVDQRPLRAPGRRRRARRVRGDAARVRPRDRPARALGRRGVRDRAARHRPRRRARGSPSAPASHWSGAPSSRPRGRASTSRSASASPPSRRPPPETRSSPPPTARSTRRSARARTASSRLARAPARHRPLLSGRATR